MGDPSAAENGNFNNTLRPGQRAGGGSMQSSGSILSSAEMNDDALGEEQLDPRASQVQLVPVYVDIPDDMLKFIMDAALRAYNDLVFLPTRTTWRKEEGARRELERDVERTALSKIAEEIKKQVSQKFGGCWHVIYGHDFATYVSHRRLSFCQFQLEGANVVVWRHGG